MHAVSTSAINRTDHPAFLGVLQDSVIASRNAEDTLALLILKLQDLDRLNTSFGYHAGDSVLSCVAVRLSEELGSRARVIRIGASRFAVLLRGLKDDSHAILAGNKIERMFSNPISVDSKEIQIQVSQGIALYPEHADSASTLLLRAESALKHATAQGRSLEVCNETQFCTAEDSVHIESSLATSLQAGRIETFFQPQIDIHSGKAVGAEALLRCRDTNGEFIPPDVVVAAAERMNQLTDITFIIMNAALRSCVEWHPLVPAANVSVNVSPSTLKDPDLVESIVSALGLWGAEPQNLTIEITESTFMEDPKQSFSVMSELNELGVRVAVDDFGTGYSSLSYFKSIPAHELKIDRSFVLGMLENSVDRKIVRTVINLAHEFGLEVVAEGVEDEATLALLRKLGCDIAQGYWFARPMPGTEFHSWLRQEKPV